VVAPPGFEPTCGYLAMSRTTRFEPPTPHFASIEIEHSSRVGSPVLRIKPPHRRSDNEKFCSNFNCSKSCKMSEPELKTLQNSKTSKLNTRVRFPSPAPMGSSPAAIAHSKSLHEIARTARHQAPTVISRRGRAADRARASRQRSL
jgi:hypothetical protein